MKNHTPETPEKSGPRCCSTDDPHDYLAEDGCELCEQGAGKRPDASFLSDAILVLFAAALLSAMLSTPFFLWVIRHWDDSTAPVAQGTVQRILFVGNLGIDSQIDTEQHSFIVHGITKLQKGTRVETRKGPWSYALCDRDSALCEDMVRDE